MTEVPSSTIEGISRLYRVREMIQESMITPARTSTSNSKDQEEEIDKIRSHPSRALLVASRGFHTSLAEDVAAQGSAVRLPVRAGIDGKPRWHHGLQVDIVFLDLACAGFLPSLRIIHHLDTPVPPTDIPPP